MVFPVRSASARTPLFQSPDGVHMHFSRTSLCCFLAAIVLVTAALVTADKVTLKDGTVLEGTALKEPNGYWFKGVDGQRRHLTDDEVAGVEKGPIGSTPGSGVHRYVGSIGSVKQRADDVDTPVAGVAIWQEYIDSKPSGADLKFAQDELAKWKKLQADGAEKIKGRWVGGEERKDIIQKHRKLELEGVQLLRNNETLGAMKKLQEAQTIYPNSFPSAFWLGWLAMLQDKDAQALNYFNQALRLHPNSPETLANMGLIQWHKRQFQDAIMTLYKAAQNGDTKEIAQDLVNAIEVLPPMLRRTEKLRPVLEASRLLAVKYGISGPNQQMLMVPLRDDEEKPGHGGSEPGEHTPGMWYSGTGFIISPEGMILTNRHVVDGAKTLLVQLTGNVEKAGHIVNIDNDQDLALIKIDSDKELPVVHLSPSNSPNEGAEVTVMGFPLIDRFGPGVKITRGIVTSSEHLDVGTDVMVDAKVNPGNSGGPILDKYGNVMAIVSMKSLSTAKEDSFGLGISAGQIRKFLAKNKLQIPQGIAGPAPLSTEDIVAKVKPATVCILSTR